MFQNSGKILSDEAVRLSGGAIVFLPKLLVLPSGICNRESFCASVIAWPEGFRQSGIDVGRRAWNT